MEKQKIFRPIDPHVYYAQKPSKEKRMQAEAKFESHEFQIAKRNEPRKSHLN